jgi:hypothetical protein
MVIHRDREKMIKLARGHGFRIGEDPLTRELLFFRTVRPAGDGTLLWEMRVPWQRWIDVEAGYSTCEALISEVVSAYEEASKTWA